MANHDGVRFFAMMVLCCLAGIGAVRADALADPTRPAPEWLAAQPAAPGGIVAGGDAAPGLRVLVMGRARPFAIIDGQMVRLGETYNGARLAGIHPGGVVLHKDGSKETLSMSPAVVKIVRVSQPAAGRAGSKKNVANGESK